MDASISVTIQWLDYTIFAAILISSLAIGIYYGFFGTKNRTNEEFLMAGRSMSTLPVTMSLLCSFTSAVSLLGYPVEAYFYGAQYMLFSLCMIPLTLMLAYLFVPVYFDLHLTSAYEYFEWRFSRKVRMVATILAILHMLIYMPATILGPSLALDQVTGLDYRLTSAIIFGVCILYSSIGGLKAVLWTDALQAFVMFLALGIVIVLGIIEGGGPKTILETLTDSDRISTWNFDADLRTRHTLWTCVIGGVFMLLPSYGSSQAQIQRYNSVRSLKQARRTLVFNMIGMMAIIILSSIVGLIIFAQYHDCDPIESKGVKSADQLLPYFVVHVLGKYPGVPGLFIAGLTSGTLSTISSALNSLTTLITEDYVKKLKPGLSEEKLAIISKCISASAGCLTFGLVFLIAIVNETMQILPFSSLFFGFTLGPIVGVFMLGMFCPWTNEMGALIGIVAGAANAIFVGLGSILASRQGYLPNQRLNLTTEGCDFGNSSMNGHTFPYNENWKNDHENDSFALQIFSISYVWQSCVGILTTVIFGLIFSFAWTAVCCRKLKTLVNIKLLSKPTLRLWLFLFGKKRMTGWVDFTPIDFGNRNGKN